MKTFCVFLSILAFAVLMSVATANANLVSLYTFDDTLGNAVSGAPTGTMTSGSASYVTGKVGKAISLNGSQSVDTTTAGIPKPGAGQYTGTVSYWISSSDWSTSPVIISGANGTGNCFQSYFDSSGCPGIDNHDDARKRFKQEAGWSYGSTDTWYLVTETYTSGVNFGSATIYRDGLAQTLRTSYCEYTTGTTTSAWTQPLYVGSYTSSSYFLTGLLDDVAVWDEELSVGKATALYNLTQDTLNYGVANADALFEIYDAQGSGVVGGQTWAYATGLSGFAGDVLNSNSVILDELGNGVQIVPEPSTLALLATGLIGLVCYAWRKRK